MENMPRPTKSLAARPDDYPSPQSSADESYNSDEPSELELNLAELKECASLVLGMRWVNARKLTRGRFHEIFVLDFEPCSHAREAVARAGFSCIARLTRSQESEAKARSELAIMRYVKSHTSVPVTKIFYKNLNPSKPVGAPVVLMERLPGRRLYRIWDSLLLEHKKATLEQIASALSHYLPQHVT